MKLSLAYGIYQSLQKQHDKTVHTMKLIYKAENINEAHIISGMLKAQGIENHVGGHYLQGGIGELMTMGFANIHVNDNDVDAAESIINAYESQPVENQSTDEDTGKKSWPYWILIAVIVVVTAVLNMR